MSRRVITAGLILLALFAWPIAHVSGDIPREPSATAAARPIPQVYPYDEAIDLGLVQPVRQKLPWCTGPDAAYASFAEADAHALDRPVCQVNPEGSTVFIGASLSKPSDSP
jgi:hypothetical protein